MATTQAETSQTTYIDEDGFSTVITQTDAYLELTKSLGEFSIMFKGCYDGVDNGFYDFWLFL